MKQKKPNSLARILSYAGGHKNLTILGCILSALSAVLGLAPYLCVWLVARSILAAWPSLDGAGDLGRFGWMAVWFAIGSILLYRMIFRNVTRIGDCFITRARKSGVIDVGASSSCGDIMCHPYAIHTARVAGQVEP